MLKTVSASPAWPASFLALQLPATRPLNGCRELSSSTGAAGGVEALAGGRAGEGVAEPFARRVGAAGQALKARGGSLGSRGLTVGPRPAVPPPQAPAFGRSAAGHHLSLVHERAEQP